MKQVIVKYELSSREEFEQKLSDLGLDFGMMYWQHDRVYLPRGENLQNMPRLTIRTEMRALDKPARYELILKRFISDSGAIIMNRTPIEDYTEVAQILHQLGFVKKAEISRQRQDLKMGDNVILHLDKIEGLAGDYAKLETILEEGEKVTEVLADLRKTLLVLGVGEERAKPYYEMLAPVKI